jgi:cytochrome c553
MNRFTMTLTAAAASALVAGAIVALPAIGDDSAKSSDEGVAALAACLRSHGLDGAPDDPLALKPWIAQRQEQDPVAVKKAMNACQQFQTGGPDKPKFEEKRELTEPDVQKLVACMRANGLDAPSDPAALKRWLQQEEASDPDAVKRVMPTCKMQLDPQAAKGAKPGVCGDAAKPGDEVPKPEETKPAQPSTGTSTQST